MSDEIQSRSKFLSKVLRHSPELIGLQLNEQGWTPIDQLLDKIYKKGPAYLQPFDREILERVVAENNKQRFAISEDGTMIRANQGHSVSVDLGYPPETPPETLFHGTAAQNLVSIKANGIHKGSRHHVHLSPDRETAQNVGGRHGAAKVLTIQTGKMHQDGYLFYRSDNGVWLTDHIPADYIWW